MILAALRAALGALTQGTAHLQIQLLGHLSTWLDVFGLLSRPRIRDPELRVEVEETGGLMGPK